MPLRTFMAAIGLLLTLNTVQAAEARFIFDLEAQDLKSTLKNIATQTNVQLRYADELLLGKTAPALHGRYTLRQALEQLLNGTELSYKVNPPGVVTIQRRANATHTPNQNDDSFQLPAVKVTAHQILDYQELAEKNRTGSYTGLTPIETPATVDLITREEIEEKGLRNLIEVYNSAPGVTAGNLPGEPGVTSMRGFSRATGYLIDGVRAVDPLLVSRNYDTYNFEQVEILKGPASVIHGNGALVGAINIVTKKPRLGESHVDGLLSYGSFDTLRGGASLNQPIGEKAAVQTSLSYAGSNGYIDDTDSRKIGLTSGILFEPTDQLSLSASLDYFQDRFSTPYQATPLISQAAARNPSGLVSSPGDLIIDQAIRDQNYNVSDGLMKSKALWLRTHAAYNLTEEWMLRNEFSIFYADRFWANSEDFSFNIGTGLLDRSTTKITHDHRFWSERLMTAYDGQIGQYRNRFSAGLEYIQTDLDSKRRFGTTTSVDPFDPDRGAFPSDTAMNFGTRQDFKSKVGTGAVFLEDAFNVTPEWLLTGALRYEMIDLDRRIDDKVSDATTRFGNDFNSFSWRIGTVYDFTPKTALFAQYSKATIPVTTLLLSNTSRAGFDLSTGYSIETGVKSSFWDDQVIVTASIYQIKQDDILTRDPNNPRLTIQGGSQRTRGAELDIAVALTNRWEVGANGTIMKPEFTDLTDGAGDDLSGNRPQNVPKRMFNLFTSYRMRAIPLTIGGNLRNVGDFYTNNANTIKVDGYTLLDAYVSYNLLGGNLMLRGRNLTDELYADWSGYSATQVYLGAPRSFDLTYRIAF